MKLGDAVILLLSIILIGGFALVITGYVSMKSIIKYWFFYAPITSSIILVVMVLIAMGVISSLTLKKRRGY